jgi:ubiquinone/menaquinone biosynthesis C-methylase UbiE
MNDNKEKTIEFFNASASTWYDMISSDINFLKYPLVRLHKSIQHLANLCENKESVIDIGCGNGIAFGPLSELGFREIHAIDFSENMICEARKTVSTLSSKSEIILRPGELDSLYPDENQFDAVFALGVATYSDDVPQFLHSLSRILKPGGIACLDFRNKAFNLFSTNAYTSGLSPDEIKEIVNEFSEQLAKFSQTEADLDVSYMCSCREKIGSEKVHLRIEDMDFAQNVKIKDWNKPFTMERKQYMPGEIEKMISVLPLEPVVFDYYHFHPFPPVFEKIMPQFFNWLGYMFEPLGNTPIGFLQASAFLAVLRKNK